MFDSKIAFIVRGNLAEEAANLNLVGLALHGSKKAVDKAIKGLKLHPQAVMKTGLLTPGDTFVADCTTARQSLPGGDKGVSALHGCHPVAPRLRVARPGRRFTA